MKQKEELLQQAADGNIDGNMMALDIDDNGINMNHSMMGMDNGGMIGDSYAGFGDDNEPPQFMAQQAAAAAVMNNMQNNGLHDDDDENEFKYDYNNPLDSSHFVPDIMNNNQQNK